MNKVIYLFFCMVFVAKNLCAQVKPLIVEPVSYSNAYLQPATKAVLPAASMMVKQNFYSSNLAFFCKKELKFEKATGIPFKFRLGSVQYVDYLEGKKGVGILKP